MSDFPLDPDHQIKFDLLKEHFKGLVGLLQALKNKGYVPDYGMISLPNALDKVYADVEGH